MRIYPLIIAIVVALVSGTQSCSSSKSVETVESIKDKARKNSNVLTRHQIQESGANDIYDLMQGHVPGVNVGYGDSGRYITIRGNNSLESGVEPIFVVDGNILDNSADVDATVAINDIDRIEVQKSGEAYGVRGANGAIIITTLRTR